MKYKTLMNTSKGKLNMCKNISYPLIGKPNIVKRLVLFQFDL